MLPVVRKGKHLKSIDDYSKHAPGADPGILERGPDKGAKPQTERRRGVWGPTPENFEKLDAIFCNLAYIFGIIMASDIIQNWAFAEQKTLAATISKPTDIR